MENRGERVGGDLFSDIVEIQHNGCMEESRGETVQIRGLGAAVRHEG